MNTRHASRPSVSAACVLVPILALSGCVGSGDGIEEVLKTAEVDSREQACLARAMFFESNRSSEEGMLAVGTVVMNRVESASYPDDICAVVSQPRQFAPGVMTREMGAGRELAMATAAKVLQGERHASVRTAQFFHTAGYQFGYPNMHYVAIAGGNAFYEKIGKDLRSRQRLTTQSEIAAGKKSFDFAALRTEETEDAQEPTSALALDGAHAPTTKSPFLSLFDGLTRETSARTSSPAAQSARSGSEPDSARFGVLPGVGATGDLRGTDAGGDAAPTQ